MFVFAHRRLNRQNRIPSRSAGGDTILPVQPSVGNHLGARWRALIVGTCLLLGACSPQTQVADNSAVKRPAPPVAGAFTPESVAGIDVLQPPIMPELSADVVANIRATYAIGAQRGQNPNVFSKFGDCMTDNPHFLVPFADGNYTLGAHSALDGLIKRFAATPARQGKSWQANAFGTPSLSAAGGFNVASPLDPIWSNPEWCGNSESPLECELRAAKPAFVVIMFGTNDVGATDADTYHYYLRTIVSSTLDAGVVPILSTFPNRPEDAAKTTLFNQIMIQTARDYNVPLMNLYRALEALPGKGVDPKDTIHLNLPPDGRADIFDDAHLGFGFPVRNLVTLQALDVVVKAAAP